MKPAAERARVTPARRRSDERPTMTVIIRKRSRRTKVAAGVALLALALAGGVALKPEPRAPAPQATAPVLSPLAVGNPEPAAPQVPPGSDPLPPLTFAPPRIQFGAFTAQADHQFAQLADAKASYADHRKAYAMAATCMREKGPFGVRIVDRPCELSENVWRDPATRKRLVTECAEAGDCWSEMWNEGPRGHYPVFTEGEFAQLEAKALAKAVDKADPFALRYKANELRDLAKLQPPEQARATLKLALSYDIASAAGVAYLDGRPYSAKADPDLQKRLALYPLTQDEVDASTNEARRLVGVFKKAKQS